MPVRILIVIGLELQRTIFNYFLECHFLDGNFFKKSHRDVIAAIDLTITSKGFFLSISPDPIPRL